jgi:hypothetical protein
MAIEHLGTVGQTDIDRDQGLVDRARRYRSDNVDMVYRPAVYDVGLHRPPSLVNRVLEFAKDGEAHFLVQHAFPLRVGVHEVGEETARHEVSVIDNHETTEDQCLRRIEPIEKGNGERMIAIHKDKIQGRQRGPGEPILRASRDGLKARSWDPVASAELPNG